MRRLVATLAIVAACGGNDGETNTADAGHGGHAGHTNDGGAAMSAGGTSSAGGQGAGGGIPDCTSMSDELDDAATLSCWQQRHVVEGTPAQYTLLDIGETVAGHLSIEPTHCGWFENGDGPLLFKEVTGNYVVEIDVSVHNRTSLATPPTMEYNSAGLLARDPASATAAENWLMYNIGYQAAFVGSEHKTTVDGASTLVLTPGSSSGRLRMCRVGNDFHMLRWLDDETDWTSEATHTRADLPATLQVGMIANGYEPPPDLHARFDYIRFGSVTEVADCTAALSPL